MEARRTFSRNRGRDEQKKSLFPVGAERSRINDLVFTISALSPTTNRATTANLSSFHSKGSITKKSLRQTKIAIPELIDFCVNTADKFCLFELPGAVQQRNQMLREMFWKEDASVGRREADSESENHSPMI
jgi:hypothetical protein